MQRIEDDSIYEEISQASAPSGLTPIKDDIYEDVELPEYANGSSPDFAVPQSPLSAVERRSIMGVGNKKGQLNALKLKFGEDNVVLKPDGDFVVNHAGVWKSIDPNTFDASDPYKATASILGAAAGTAAYAASSIAAFANTPFKALGITELETDPAALAESLVGAIFSDDSQVGRVARETVGEIAENETEIAGLAGSAAAAAATGGASLAVQAGAQVGIGLAQRGAQVVMGRLEGTYEQDPEETLQDVALESLITAAGTIIPPGLRPTAKWLASTQAAKKVGELAAKLPPPALDSVFNGWGSITKLGGDNVRRLFEDANTVQKYINMQARYGGEQGAKQMALVKTDIAKEMAQTAKAALDATFVEGRANVAKALPANQMVDPKQMTNGWLKSLQESGLVELDADAAKKLIMAGKNTPDDMASALRIKNKDAFRQTLQAADDTGRADLLVSDEAYDALKTLVDKVQTLRGFSPGRGLDGVKRLMDVSSTLGEATYQIKSMGDDLGINLLSRIAGQADEAFKGSATAALGGADSAAGKAFMQFKQDYSTLKNGFGQLIDASKNTRNKEALPNLVNKLSTRRGANTSRDIDTAVSTLEKYSKPLASAFNRGRGELQSVQAAEAFVKAVEWNAVRDTSKVVAAAAGATVNPLVAAGIVGGVAATSARIPKAAGAVSYNVLKLMRGEPRMTEKLLTNPATARILTQSWIDASRAEMETREQLMTPFTGGQP